MQIITDLQIHSKHSRATSAKMDLHEISYWASLKGINIVTCGDWTHPLWFREIKNNLKEVNNGLYTLKQPRPQQKNPVYFLLTTEISSIYSQDGKTRRVHNLIFSPNLATCEKIINNLIVRGAKLMSDGRPIVGLSSKEVLEIALEANPNILFVPAHIWTPWFSLFGSKSGFDSVDECFKDLSKYIYAVETGLSSDPVMNWQIPDLDSRSIVSFSDAHSGQKLGREATVFVNKNPDETFQIPDITFNDIAGAIKQQNNSKLKIGYTIEFFPEEGKYHWSGHRNCNVVCSPAEIKKNGEICPKCKKPLTIGVENRIFDLSKKIYTDKDLLYKKNKNGVIFISDLEKKHRPFVSLIPLLEILEHILKSPTAAKNTYQNMTATLGTEFDVLLKLDLEKIKLATSETIGNSIDAVRQRKVRVEPGYDGVFGKIQINISQNENNKSEKNQQPLF